MSDKYLTRRDFIKASAVAAGITIYAAKTAGAREEGTLESKSNTTERVSDKPIDYGYMEMILQVRSNAILYGDIN